MELANKEREDVLREIVGFLKKRNRIAKEKDLYEKLIQREKLGSTAIGGGVAIPHCKMKGIKDPIVMLALSRKGVNFHSLDEKPSHLIFLVASSPDNPSLNLQILAAIAHLVRKANSLLKKILGAENAQEILDIIREEEEKINE
jgi:PTS system nitrogen regulatory IIA component